MKILTWFVGIIVTVVGAIYVTAFTTVGNNAIKPLLETELQKQLHLPCRLQTFHLRMDGVDVDLVLNKNNTIHIKGDYSLFSQSFDLHYKVALDELKSLQKLTKMQLQSSFHTLGEVKGDMKLIDVDGRSDVAKSATEYHVVLTDLKPTSIIAKINGMDLSSLLFIFKQKAYANAQVNLDVNFKNITPHKLDGTVTMLTKNGQLNSELMKQDFNLTIPKSLFDMNLDAKMDGDAIDYRYILNANLAKISSVGHVVPEPLALNLNYKVNVKELALLKPITGADLRGALRLVGALKGTKEKMDVSGASNLAGSTTTFSAVLKDFAPKSIKADIVGLKLQKLLYMLKQPHYADGVLDMHANITNADAKALKGVVKTDIKEGLFDSKYLTKAYAFTSLMPTTEFKTSAITTLDKNLADTKVEFSSTLADLNITEARFNINDASLKSDYRLKVHDLNELYFVTQRHLKGTFKAYGELKKAKDLDFTAHSNVAGGKVNAKLHNDDFHADLNGLHTLKLLDILLYPQIFKASIDADLDYNLAHSKGKLSGFLSHGTFTKNRALDLVKKYAHTNLYKEKFQGDIRAHIHKEKVLAAFDLRSNKSSIKSKNTKLNTLTKKIYSKIDVVANKNPLSITLKGDIDSPKVGIDASKLVKKEATKALQKAANRLLKGLF